HLRGALPDVAGARFEATIQTLTEGMRPPKGSPWDTWEHRAADALVLLAEREATSRDDGPPTDAVPPTRVVEVPLQGPAMLAGIPLPDSLVEPLRANASLDAVLVDDTGQVLDRAARRPAISPRMRRAVLARDGHCRVPGCTRRHGLE